MLQRMTKIEEERQWSMKWINLSIEEGGWGLKKWIVAYWTKQKWSRKKQGNVSTTSWKQYNWWRRQTD